MDAKQTCRRMQFSLKKLLLLMVLISLGLGWLANEFRSHSQLLREMKSARIDMHSDCPSLYPAWLSELFSETPVKINRVCVHAPLTAKQIDRLRGLPHLQWIDLKYRPTDPITADELADRLGDNVSPFPNSALLSRLCCGMCQLMR